MTVRQSWKEKLVAGLGGAVYVSWLFAWIWVALLYIERFLESPVGKIIKPDVAPNKPITSPSSSTGGFVLPESVLIIIAVVGAIGLIVAAVYVIFRTYIPTVQRTAQAVVQKTAVATTEQVIKHHIVPAKKRRLLTMRVAFWLRVTLTVLPVVIVFAIQDSTPFISREIAKAGALILALFGLCFVLMQYACMYYWRIDETDDRK